MTLEDIEALTDDDLLAAIDVPLTPARLECALLALTVLRTGMARTGSDVSANGS
jgi:nitrogen fixation NifU-like protein